MTEIISIRFNERGKAYFFDPSGLTITKGEKVIVETSKGLEYGECIRGNHEIDDDALIQPLRPVIRIATEEDNASVLISKEKEQEAFDYCREKIDELALEMKLVSVEYGFEGNKILFFFTSDNRVDFRELVKDLAGKFRARIELRQIGVRDEAKMLGGLGVCGKQFCCSQFLNEFHPVSIKMAKTQGLSLNPAKISGSCGRLMCCLKYEESAYEDLVKKAPKIGAFVETPSGKGSITNVNL
ncbi:MAG: stage 0 sporulation family protein, partial [Oscillospiraceae bacterium]|nr:stage 0 sporulation family protein [Oscillospiraceae bacterium]